VSSSDENEEYLGCGNNPCFVDPPRKGGIYTQGSCRCFADIDPSDKRHRVQRGVVRIGIKLRAANKEIARLVEELRLRDGQ
jgi:hypothetical protein